MIRIKLFAQALLSTSLMLCAATTPAAELNFKQQEFQLPVETEKLIFADLNGDNLQEVLLVAEKALHIYFQTENGFDFDNNTSIEFPGQAIGWDLSSQYSATGNTAIIALIDGKEVLAWSFEDQTLLEPQIIKSNLNGFLSKGMNRLHFSRDINGDAIDDLLIPGAGIINLHISDGRTASGNYQYQAPLSIRSELRIDTRLNGEEIERRTGQSIRIPMMELRDVNSDGFDDLVSRTEEALNVFIANTNPNAYFPHEASYGLDILEIEERLGEVDFENLDFSNLTGLLALSHEEILDDVDNDGIDDLLLREGGKVSLFAGNKTGMEFTQARQVLRSGGNVLSIFLRDENEDGLKDLWLWRVENISVGDLFVWLALSGSIAIEAFIYPNDGEIFSRRPSRKITIDLKFPSAIKLASSFREIRQELEDARPDEEFFSSLANLDEDVDQQDLMLITGNQLQFFLNSIRAQNSSDENSDAFLGALNYSRERDNYAFNIREIIENITPRNTHYLDAVSGKSADSVIELNQSVVNGDIIPITLNADKRDDVIVFTEIDSSHIRGLLLLSD